MAGFNSLGINPSGPNTVGGIVLNSHTAPASTNAYVNYDGTNVGINAPTGKGFAYTVNGVQIGFITAGGTFGASNVSPGLSSNSWNAILGLDSAAGGSSGLTLNVNSTGGNKLTGVATDGASAIALAINSRNTLSTAGSELAEFQNNGVRKSAIVQNGSLVFAATGAPANTDFGIGADSASTWIKAPSTKSVVLTVATLSIAQARAVGANVSAYDGQLDVSHLAGGSGALTSVTGGTGAGTGPTITTTGCDDLGGLIQVLTGTTPAASNASILTANWAHAFNTAPKITFSPGNAAAAALSGTTAPFMSSSTTQLLFNAGSAALTATTTYIWYYHVTQ